MARPVNLHRRPLDRCTIFYVLSAFKTIRCTLIRFNYIFFGSFIVMFFQLPKLLETRAPPPSTGLGILGA